MAASASQAAKITQKCSQQFLLSEVGGVSPTGKSYSFRSCVRASEAACACETMLLPWLGCGSSQRPPGCRRRVPRALRLSVGQLAS